MAVVSSTPSKSYGALKAKLLSFPGPVLPPAASAPNSSMSHDIATLLLHPSLEAALHILNRDLPSAHFLVRHMQAPPQYESMMLHGILHRVEGDYDNARAWYDNVRDSDVFREVWGDGKDRLLDFVGKIEVLRKEKRGRGEPGEKEGLEKESLREIRSVIEFCEQKFGVEKVEDASKIWVQSDEHRKMGNDMVVGGEGWRQF